MPDHPSFSQLRAQTQQEYERFAPGQDRLNFSILCSLILIGIAGLALLLVYGPVGVAALLHWLHHR